MAKRTLEHNIDTFRPNAKKVLKEAVLKIKGQKDNSVLLSIKDLEAIMSFRDEKAKADFKENPVPFINALIDELLAGRIGFDYGQEQIIKYSLFKGIQYSEVSGILMIFSEELIHSEEVIKMTEEALKE